MLKRWVALCLGKLCEDFVLAKYMFISEVGHLQFHQVLVDPCPLVRAAVVSSLGELFGASQGNLTQSNQPPRLSPFQGGGFNMLPPMVGEGPPLTPQTPMGMPMPPFPPSGMLGGGGLAITPRAPGAMPPPSALGGGLRSTPSFGSLGGGATPSMYDGNSMAPGGSISGPVPVPAAAPTPAREPYADRAAVEQLELRRSELQLALHILDRLNDGSAMVRREAVVALSKVLS